MGRRLCTADELASNKCCGTGCHYDDILTWQTGSVSKSGNNNPGKKYPKKVFGRMHIIYFSTMTDADNFYLIEWSI